MKTWALCSAVNPGNWKKEELARQCSYNTFWVSHHYYDTSVSIYRAVHRNCVNNTSPTGWNTTVLSRNIAFHFCLWTCSHCKFAVTSKCHWNGNCSELCRSCYVYIILQCRTRWALCLNLSSSGKTNTAIRFFWHPHPRRFRCDQFMLKIPT